MAARDQHALWDRIAVSFDATRRRTWPHVVAFLQGLPAGARVLDLMCGNGRHLRAAHDAGLEPVGLDWSPPLARFASRLGPVVIADATRLPFADASFDACIYVAGLHGIPEAEGRAASLRELHRILRPEGVAQVTVWSRHAPRFATQATSDVVVPWRAGGLDEPRTYHLYTADSLRAALDAAGLRVESIEPTAIASPQPDNIVAVARRTDGRPA